MTRLLIVFLTLVNIMLLPNMAFSAEHKINFQVSCQEDNTACGEIWYNDHIVWRITFLCAEAKPVFGNKPLHTTIIIPEIVDGVFSLRISP